MFSSLFPNPHRPSEIADEEQAKRAIDTFLSYRRKEVLLTILLFWCIALGMVFTAILTVRAAFLVF